jgi:hypothetical protein
MINQTSIDAVNASRVYEGQFVKPLYDSYCWSNLPRTIRKVISGRGEGHLPADVYQGLSFSPFDRVILIFLDGFGWNLFERYRERYPFLKRFGEEGVVSKITSMFPSTTTAHTSLLYTRQLPSQTGLYEWQYYEPLADAMIIPLAWAYVGQGRESLKASGLQPSDLYPNKSLFLSLHNGNSEHVYSKSYQPYEIMASSTSQQFMRGAIRHGYKTISEALIHLADSVVLEKHAKAFYTLYIESLDSIQHRNGPDTRQTAAEFDTLMIQFERLLHANLRGRAKNTLLLIAADHGQIGFDPAETIYLDGIMGQLAPMLRTTRKGEPLLPAGSMRDMFLYTHPEALDEAHGLLTQWLEGRAVVVKTTDLITEGYFGPLPPTERFLERVGNLVILPTQHHTVWWHGKDKPRMELRGMHGGLSPQEMETPFLALAYL